MSRGSRAAALLIALAIAAPLPMLSRAQQAAGDPAVVLRLAPRNEHYRPRIEAAARESVRWFREWLGPLPPQGFAIDDGSAAADGSGAPIRVTLDLPWVSAPSTMDVESRVAFGLARTWWPGWTRDPDARPIVDGLAWYLQSRVTAELFTGGFGRPGHGVETLHFFGGTIPWVVPSLVRGPWTAGLGELPQDADVLTLRMALAFGTIERLVGWPAVEGALTALAPRASAGGMTPGEIEQVMSSAVGYPLSWLMEPVRAGRGFDYAIDAVTSVPCDGPSCWRTTVVVANRGDAAFSGVSGEPAGPYEQGSALSVLARFADGAEAEARWDGRAASRTFVFESGTPAAQVQLDPAGLLLLDRSALDHRWQAVPDTSVPLTKWLAWWLLWMQDAILSHTALL